MSRFRSLALLAVGASSLTLPVLAIADTTAATSATEPEPGAVEILAPDELVGGATLGELSASWWQWAASQSEGFSCEQGQHGAVFFMPPQVERSWDCVVPEGIPIYVIVHGGVCSSNALPPHFGRNEEELQACVDSLPGTPPTTKVSVNGQDVADLDTYRVTSPMFTVFVSDDAGQFFPAGVSLATSATTAFVIAPPPPGEYVITVIDEGRVLGYTINVTVEAPQIIEPTETTEAPQASDAPDVTAVSTPHSMTTTPRSADGDAATTPPQESDSLPSGPVSSVSATSLGSSSTPDELWVEGGTPPSVVLRTGSETVSVAPH
jgi:hypothetical protein